MFTRLRHFFYLLMGISALLLTWPHAFAWMRDGGSITNPMQFFFDAIRANHAAAFLSIDLAFVWAVFMVWVVVDTRRIGMGRKWGWLFVALSYLGVCVALPFYLIARERFIDNSARSSQTH